jgi:hypothetical protein
MLKKTFQQFSGSFFDLELKTDIHLSYSAVSGSSLKLFEIPISPAGLYAVARTVCVGQILLHSETGYARRCLRVLRHF